MQRCSGLRMRWPAPLCASGTSLAPTGRGTPPSSFVLSSRMRQRKNRKLNAIANAIALILRREVKPEEHGLHSYFNFRSAAEQAQLKEPAWA